MITAPLHIAATVRQIACVMLAGTKKSPAERGFDGAGRGSVIHGLAGACRDTDVLDQVLDMLRRRCGQLRNHEGHREVDHRADGAEGIRLDPEDPVAAQAFQVLPLRYEEDALVLEDIEQRDADTRQHARDRAGPCE